LDQAAAAAHGRDLSSPGHTTTAARVRPGVGVGGGGAVDPVHYMADQANAGADPLAKIARYQSCVFLLQHRFSVHVFMYQILSGYCVVCLSADP
jgi:hypothetical protein